MITNMLAMYHECVVCALCSYGKVGHRMDLLFVGCFFVHWLNARSNAQMLCAFWEKTQKSGQTQKLCAGLSRPDSIFVVSEIVGD